MTTPTAIAELSQAQRMLSEARTVGDFRDIRDFATSLRAWGSTTAVQAALRLCKRAGAPLPPIARRGPDLRARGGGLDV